MQLTSVLPMLLFLQDAAPSSDAGSNTIRIIAALGALLLLGIVIMRRKRAPKKDEDEEF